MKNLTKEETAATVRALEYMIEFHYRQPEQQTLLIAAKEKLQAAATCRVCGILMPNIQRL